MQFTLEHGRLPISTEEVKEVNREDRNDYILVTYNNGDRLILMKGSRAWLDNQPK